MLRVLHTSVCDLDFLPPALIFNLISLLLKMLIGYALYRYRKKTLECEQDLGVASNLRDLDKAG